MIYLHAGKIKELEQKSKEIRLAVVQMLSKAGSGHIAGSLGMADIFSALYFHALNHNPKKPLMPERDRLVLSNGHICPAQYASLALAGYFPKKELATLRQLGSRLQGHPQRGLLPGIETTSGPLGCGLGQAAGMAYGARMDSKLFHIYCLMSDGEHQEGNTWESAMFAAKNRLANLTAIIDRNYIQIDGLTEDIMPLESLADKYRSFNWHVIEINGHDFNDILSALAAAKAMKDRPTAIIAHTIPGRGIPEIEYDFRWHGAVPGTGPGDKIANKNQARHFINDIREMGVKIKEYH